MLQDPHQLNRVVSRLFDAGQHMIREMVEPGHVALLPGHAHMGFVHQGGDALFDHGPVPPHIGLRAPCLGVEKKGLGILNHPMGMGRDAVSCAPFPVDAEPEQGAVGHLLFGKSDFPDIRPVSAREGILGPLLPLGKGPHKIHGRGIWRPLPDTPGAPFVPRAIDKVGIGSVPQAPVPGQKLLGKAHLFQASHQYRSVGFQPGIQADEGRGQFSGMVQARTAVPVSRFATQ